MHFYDRIDGSTTFRNATLRRRAVHALPDALCGTAAVPGCAGHRVLHRAGWKARRDSTRHAVRAQAVKNKFMAANRKTAACKAVNVRNTAGQLEHAAALVAMKMVMVRLSGSLVDGDSSRKSHGGKPAFFEQTFDVAVNSRDPEALHLALRRIQHLLRRQRVGAAFECLANCGPLPGVAPIFLRHLRH